MKDLEKEVLEQSQLKDKDLEPVFGGNGDFGGEGDVIPEGSQSRIGFILPEDSDVLSFAGYFSQYPAFIIFVYFLLIL